MCEHKKLTPEQIVMLNEPLPQEAIKKHPTKNFLSTIKAIYVTERLNRVFGVGSWRVKTDFVVMLGKMVVTKTTLEIPEYGIYYECYGGNDNADLGDAYKGSTTDAITKIGSYLGIGADIWKGLQDENTQHAQKQLTLRERIVSYINKMDAKTKADYLNYFQIPNVEAITDAKAVEIAEFEKKKTKQ